MSDEELLALLEAKAPEELTPGEIDLLRRRAAESAEVREALAAQLQIDSRLHEALGPIQLSPAAIAERAKAQQRSSAGTLAIVLLIVLPLLAIGGVLAVLANRDDAVIVAELPQQADADNADAAEPQEQTAPQPAPDDKPAESGAETPPAVNVTGDETPNATPAEQPPANADDAPPSPPAASPPPWQAALDLAGDPPPLHEVAFQVPDLSSPQLKRDGLEAWFDAVPRSSFRLGHANTQHGRAPTIEGIGRLLSPWPEDSALRLHLENFNLLKMHLYHGERGVSLVYYEGLGHRWGAYVTQREADQPKPKEWFLTSTDDERGNRTGLRFGGPIELRYHDGEVILSRGDIVLVSAPLAGPPTDVFFEGRATVHGIELVRSRGVPTLPELGTVVYDSDRPADLPWTARKPEIAQPEMLPEGGVRFAADKASERIDCHAPLPITSPCEVIVQLSGVTPGTSVFLGRTEGKAFEVVRFYRDRRSGQLAARLRGWDDEWEADFDSPNDKFIALIQPDCWVRMQFGCGNFRWWISSDGRHWAQPEHMHDHSTPDFTSLGLQIVANRPQSEITVKRLILRRLDGIASLASQELIEQAPPVVTASSPGQWLLEALRHKPAEADSLQWLRACSVRALAGGAHRDIAYAILEALLDDAAQRGLPVEQQLAALDDAMRMCWDLRDQQMIRRAPPRRYVDVGRWASDHHHVPAWSTIRPHYLAAPVYSWLQEPVDLDPLIRDELIHAAHAGSPERALALSRELRLFQLHRERLLVDWVESLARRAMPRQPAGELARLKDSWREPLIEELSKEAYNAMTELEAVLESQAWDEAARLVTSVDAEAAPGVAPVAGDKTLLASLPVAIQLTLADYPQLREALGERFAALARLRLAQAMATGDAATIELATVQFAGTPAAAEAHRWLGDRALASGWFARAIAEYEKAQSLSPSLSVDLQARARLAAAMLGLDAESPVTRPVEIGDLVLSAAEFEALVAEMRGRGQTGLAPLAATEPSAPPPSGFETHVRSRLDGPAGDKPAEEVGRRTNQYRVPWADRQIATCVEGNRLFVSNRFQVAAYNLDNGQRLWQSQPPPGNMQRAQDWAMIAMQPLVTADRIYARLLYSANPLLVCFEKSGGKPLWIAETREREYLVSDPLIVQGQLVALAIALQQDQQGILRWCAFDPHTGELLRQRDLVRLRSTWGARSCCQVTALDDGLVAALGGITLAVDAAGGVRWIRTHVTLPTDEDPRWVLQMYQPPLVREGRVYAAQPGMRTVECLAAETGRRHWSTVLPDVVGIVGLAGDKLIVRTETGLRALDAAGGETLWRHAAENLHSFQLLDDERLLFAERVRHATQNDRWQTRFTWLDPHSGQPTATTVPPNLDDNDPRLGPLVPYKDRLFAFFGRGQHDPLRDVVELVPKGEADAVPLPQPIDPWLARVPPAIGLPAAEMLGEWRLISGQAGDRTGRIDEAHGERNVLGVRSTGAWPVILAREVTLPAQGRPRLRLRIGNDGGQHWKLEVRHGDELLDAVEIKDDTHPDRWKTLEIDLTPASGRSGWLTFRAQSANGDHVLYLRSAEILF